VKLRSSLIGAALLFGALAPVAGVAPAVCAATGPHAALVVDRGEEGGIDSYCVALPSERVSGTELIELAADQFGVTYRFGYGGGAVCMLNGVGPTEGDCFGDHPYFWGYWRGDGSGGWQWSSSGASSTTVEDGDVEGWSWGAGNGPESHPPPPSRTFASVCGESTPARPSSEEDPAPKAKRRPGDGASGVAAASASAERDASASDEGAGRDRERKLKTGRFEKRFERERRDIESRSGDVMPAPSPSALAVAPSSERAGPPAAGLAGIAVALGLAGGGAFIARRRGRRT
jgi:hypothetical protein